MAQCNRADSTQDQYQLRGRGAYVVVVMQFGHQIGNRDIDKTGRGQRQGIRNQRAGFLHQEVSSVRLN